MALLSLSHQEKKIAYATAFEQKISSRSHSRSRSEKNHRVHRVRVRVRVRVRITDLKAIESSAKL